MAGGVDAVVVPLVHMVALGGPKLAWFSRLKNSARNCSLTLSEMAAVLNSERSRVARPGPVSVALPRFPYVPKAGRLKAQGLNHWLGLPRTTGPPKAELMEGRSGLRVSPSSERDR